MSFTIEFQNEKSFLYHTINFLPKFEYSALKKICKLSAIYFSFGLILIPCISSDLVKNTFKNNRLKYLSKIEKFSFIELPVLFSGLFIFHLVNTVY